MNNFKRKLPFYILLIFALTWLFCVLPKETKYSLNLNNEDIHIKVLDTGEERTKGLSGRKSLPENSIMLFVFEEAQKYKIWMKDMNFPIDIIWLDNDKKIVHIEKNVSPDTYPAVFFPPENSLYIIEANAGFSDKNELLVGNILPLVKREF